MTKRAPATGDAPDITLRDVLTHMQAMEQRLTQGQQEHTRAIKDLYIRVEGNTRAMDNLRLRVDDLHVRIDVLEEDLTVTIKDMLHIRTHVGMAAPEA